MEAAWKKCKLGDVLTFHRGYDLPEKNRQNGNIPIISSSGISGYHNKSKIKGPGVVTGRYGTLGKVFYIKDDYWPLNTTLYVSDFKGNDPLFINYFLKTLNLANQNAAGAVPGLNRNALHLILVKIPLLPVQQKIASILSVYDDTIENNTCRIKLLEEMAQLIYREWFVHFRFPGYENVKMVDSPMGKIPEGWEIKKLGDVIELAYGKALKSNERINGPIPVYGSGGIVGYHNVSLVKSPGIIVGRKGNVGSVFWSEDDFYPIDTVFYVKTNVCLYYIYYNLLNQNFINNDAAVPGLSRNQAYMLPCLLPTKEILDNFNKNIKPCFKQIKLLQNININLKETRGILLPKLISGELDVSNLDIDMFLKPE
jgi:type I restriction enzyme S subunit